MSGCWSLFIVNKANTGKWNNKKEDKMNEVHDNDEDIKNKEYRSLVDIYFSIIETKWKRAIFNLFECINKYVSFFSRYMF